MPTSVINGIRLHWQMDGEGGPPLVLVHGSWADGRNWAPVIPSLRQSFTVLTYDRRGHSRSGRPSGQGSVREDVADLAALIEHHWQPPVHIVGNSFGGSIVLRLAAARPELFRSLIVHEPPLFSLLAGNPEAESALQAVRERSGAVAATLAAGDHAGGGRLFVDTIAFGPGAWDTLPPELRETFVFNAPTWLDEFNDPGALTIELDRLRRFGVPALLTIGDQSPPFFPLVVRRVADALPGARVHTFAGAGHVPHLSHPDLFVRTVREFIEQNAP